jgi:hypothetical protein
VKNAALSLKYVTEHVTDPITNTTTYIARLTSFYVTNKGVIDLIYSDLLSIAVPTISLIVVIVCTIITVFNLRISLRWRQQNQSAAASSASVKVSMTLSSERIASSPELMTSSSERIASSGNENMTSSSAYPAHRQHNTNSARHYHHHPPRNASISSSMTSSPIRSRASHMTSAEKQEAGVTRMLVSVCCVYVICMTPSVTRTIALHDIPGFLISGYLCNTFKVKINK